MKRVYPLGDLLVVVVDDVLVDDLLEDFGGVRLDSLLRADDEVVELAEALFNLVGFERVFRDIFEDLQINQISPFLLKLQCTFAL